jgi:hypothetical protein
MGLPFEETRADQFSGGKPGLLAERMFLQHTLAELTSLEHEAEIHYHGVLVRMLAAARRETEILLSEEMRMEARRQSAEQALAGIR